MLVINGNFVEATLYTLSGLQVVSTVESRSDLTALPKGCYILNVKGGSAGKAFKVVR